METAIGMQPVQLFFVCFFFFVIFCPPPFTEALGLYKLFFFLFWFFKHFETLSDGHHEHGNANRHASQSFFSFEYMASRCTWTWSDKCLYIERVRFSDSIKHRVEWMFGLSSCFPKTAVRVPLFSWFLKRRCWYCWVYPWLLSQPPAMCFDNLRNDLTKLNHKNRRRHGTSKSLTWTSGRLNALYLSQNASSPSPSWWWSQREWRWQLKRAFGAPRCVCVFFFYLKATLITHKTRTVLYLVPKVFRLGIRLSPQAKKLTKKRQFFSVHLSSFLRFVAENYSN